MTCNAEGRVTALDLSGLGLEGTLPPQLAGLAALESLNLSGNAFSGPIPPAWLSPDALPSLATADLSSNQLSGACLAAFHLAFFQERAGST